jgi:hypothetical protein
VKNQDRLANDYRSCNLDILHRLPRMVSNLYKTQRSYNILRRKSLMANPQKNRQLLRPKIEPPYLAKAKKSPASNVNADKHTLNDAHSYPANPETAIATTEVKKVFHFHLTESAFSIWSCWRPKFITCQLKHFSEIALVQHLAVSYAWAFICVTKRVLLVMHDF